MSTESFKSTVKHVFESMDYGSVQESKQAGEAWIAEHSENFGNYVNGKLRKSAPNEQSLSVSTGVNFSVSFHINKEDYSVALSASSDAFLNWAKKRGHARASILYSVARQLQKHSSLLAEVESISRGVHLSNTKEIDMPAIIRIFYYYAGWAQLLETECSDLKPYGPVVGVTSSSSPLVSLAFFIAPALAAGNTVTLLPHTSNCLSAFLLAQLCSSSGVPPGVINVVPHQHSDLNKCPAFDDKSVKKIAVIGSPSLGRSILTNSETLQQNHLLLLNNCVPMIVLDSADLDAVVDCTIDAAWTNQGQDPWSLKLLIVQESIYSSLKSKLSTRVTSIKTGMTFDKMSDVSGNVVDTPLVKQLQDILLNEPGCDVVQPSGPNKSLWCPSLVFSPSPSLPVLSQPDLCPVLQVVCARSAKEAVAVANHYGGGVAVSVWTESSAFAWESALKLKASTVWINCFGAMDASIPISGQTSSGSGCFLGKEGLMEFLLPVHDEPVLLKVVNPSASVRLLPLQCEEDVMDQTYKLFYGGCHKRPSSSTYKSLLNSKGNTVAVIPDANRKDVRNAVEAALKAQPSWWKRGGHNRAQIIFNLAEKLQARRSYFAKSLMETYECAEELCLQEVDECVQLLFHFASICDKTALSSSQCIGEMAVHVMREPLGVIAVAVKVSAGNYLTSLITLVGAAISFGNTCISISDLECSAPALELAQLLEVGEVPAGVINILSGDSCALLPTICGHMDIKAVWCVGSENILRTATKEVSKSNLKQCWVMDFVPNPKRLRGLVEMKSSQTKAVWLESLASFGA